MALALGGLVGAESRIRQYVLIAFESHKVFKCAGGYPGDAQLNVALGIFTLPAAEKPPSRRLVGATSA